MTRERLEQIVSRNWNLSLQAQEVINELVDSLLPLQKKLNLAIMTFNVLLDDKYARHQPLKNGESTVGEVIEQALRDIKGYHIDENTSKNRNCV